MIPITREAIRAELKADPANVGYHAVLANDSNPVDALVAMMNDPTQGVPEVVSTRLTLARLWEALPKAHASGVVNKWRSGKASVPDAAVVFDLAELADGVDVGNEKVRDAFRALESAGKITEAERDAVLALSTRPASRAQNLWGQPVVANNGTPDSMSGAVYEDNGDRWNWAV